MEQRTEEWFQSRIGMVTASRISDVMAKTAAGKISASRDSYMSELIIEKLTGMRSEKIITSSMEWGINNEEDAINVYSFHTGNFVDKTGFILHPKIVGSGASPDGLIGEDGLVEIKCPNTSNHIKSFLNGKIQKKYVFQMQWQMACTGRKWCDFVSYDPRLDGNLTIFIKRVDRDNNTIDKIEEEVLLFIKEIEENIKKLKDI